MTDLGLRGAEIAELCLEDIDWRAATVVVRKNKQRRERLLPLPPLVAKAILGHERVSDTYWYLSSTPELFAAAVKRFKPPTRKSAPR
jgi:integrase